MKITLVHAGISGCGFNSFGSGNEGSWISHGLCSISSSIKKKGFEVDLIDLRRLNGWPGFQAEITERNPDVVGLSMMSVDFDYVMKCVDLIEKTGSGIKIVVGGPHPSLRPDEVAANTGIDYIVIGEGEISFTKLLCDLRERKDTADRVIHGIKPDLDELPFVDRELYGGEEQPIVEDGRLLPKPFVTTIVGRGCMYNCRFCQPAERSIFGTKVRRRSVHNVIEELKFLREKYNFRSLMIHDDCLTENRDWVEEFCTQYKANGFTQNFVCQSRADIICKHEETVRILRDSGLVMFIIGFESGNQRVLNFLGKGTTVEHNYEAARICRKYGIAIWANYMLGIPTETKGEVMDTVEMIKKINPEHRSPAYYTPHPGSELYDYCVDKNISLIKNHEDYRRNPGMAKIKGIDYKFIHKALLESMGYSGLRRYIESFLDTRFASCLKVYFRRTALGRHSIDFIRQTLRYHEIK